MLKIKSNKVTIAKINKIMKKLNKTQLQLFSETKNEKVQMKQNYNCKCNRISRNII